MAHTTVPSGIHMHPLTLSFSPDLEDLFRNTYFVRYVGEMRWAAALSMAFFLAFGLLDPLLMPQSTRILWPIRAAVAAIALGCLAFSFTSGARRLMQPVMAVLGLAGGCGQVIMVLSAPEPANYAYCMGLVLLLAVLYAVLRLRFTWAAATGWVVMAGFEAAALLFAQPGSTFLIAATAFLFGANLAGMMAAYAWETHARLDFYLGRQLSAERQNVQNARDELETRVEERTSELRNANAALRDEVNARLQLAQKHQRLAVVVDQASEGIVIFDTGSIVIYINPAMEQISGYRADEAVGRPIEIVRSQQHPVEFYLDLSRAISSGKVWTGRIINKRKDGTLFTSDTSITPVRDRSGHIIEYVAVYRDVSRELELEAQYLQAQKMEAMGQLTGGIAHDFNNLLTAINGFAGLMELEMGEQDPLRQHVTRILGSGSRAASLVRQLLAFSRKRAVERHPQNLNAIVSDSREMLQRIIGEHIVMRTDLAGDLPPIHADASQLEQVIVNLVVNARDAMPRGGELSICTGLFTMDSGFVSAHEGSLAGDYVMLSVADTGEGISPGVREHIFEPFFTTKANGEGTGLGLATVFGIVKQYSGYITLDSHVGEGTRFDIFFPVVTAKANESKSPTVAQYVPSEGIGTILVAEDNEPVRTMAAATLRSLGYRVLTATDGLDAQRVADQFGSSIDLLLADVVMPFVNGRQLASRLGARRRHMRTLYMTGYTDSSLLPGDVLAPDTDLLQKPFTPQALIARVRAALE